jgi:hypothetical protein
VALAVMMSSTPPTLHGAPLEFASQRNTEASGRPDALELLERLSTGAHTRGSKSSFNR